MVEEVKKFRWLVRLGFAARGLVYLLIGYIALTASRGSPSPEGAFGWLQGVPFGTPLLYIAALGLVGYALFRFASVVFDVENYGSEPKGLVQRVGHGASGVAHMVLGWTAIQFAQGGQSSGGTESAAATIMSIPFGSLVLGFAGLGFMAAAAMQATSAITGSFLSRIDSSAPKLIAPLGRAGHAARAVVFLIIGWSLVQSAWLTSSSQIKTLGEAVTSLSDKGLLYTLVAAGLLMFGVFSLFLARYRIVPELDARRFVPG